jgi:hypothetical protein
VQARSDFLALGCAQVLKLVLELLKAFLGQDSAWCKVLLDRICMA